uniref:Uncharacterized protein n=1 Tax=Ciona intestinalis TaxID=7719 RepID=H2XQZ2_CIOIN
NRIWHFLIRYILENGKIPFFLSSLIFLNTKIIRLKCNLVFNILYACNNSR